MQPTPCTREAEGEAVVKGMLLAAAAAFLVGECPLAHAEIEEVVVSARKREETLQNVPVAIYALGQESIKSFGVSDLVSAAKLTPGLLISRSTNNAGANIYLRGVGSSFASVSFDQAVAVNIDNVPVGKGRAIMQSFFDMQQIEVMKGPQALFFGKNSTAGVVSVKTADPGDTMEVLGRAGYEFNGKRYYGEAVAAGPLSDRWGARLAVRGSSMDGGFFENNAFQLTGIPRPANTPQEDEYGGRLTVTYEPNETFDLNAKFSADRLENDGANGYSQLVNCQGPGGTPQPHFGVPNVADCALNRIQSTPALSAALAAGYPHSNGGQPYLEYDGLLGSLTANLRWSALTLTSVTGWYGFGTDIFDNYDLGSAGQVWGWEHTKYDSFTQELRLASSFDSPLNFSAGVFYDDVSLDYNRAVRLRTHAADPATGRTDSFNTGGTTQGNTYSVFGELIWAIAPTVELSGGARYSREVKDTVLGVFYANPLSGFAFVAAPIPDRFKDDNISTSATLRWRPSEQLTWFASYKEGYKSGGTNLSEIPFGNVSQSSIDFDSELVRGGELGMKARLLDGSLWLGATAYRYTFEDLQVAVFNPTTVTRQLSNAGKLNTTGAELDIEYDVPSVDRLKFQGSVYYSRARFADYVGACYTGQSIVAGCNKVPHPVSGVFNAQDYAGRPAAHAPEWTGTLGASYDLPIVAGKVMAGLNAQVRYTDKYFLQETLAPTQLQDAYYDVSASVRFYAPEHDRWELAIIGRNLTDKLVGANALDETGTGSGTGTANGRLADTYLVTHRPREISVQLAYRF